MNELDALLDAAEAAARAAGALSRDRPQRVEHKGAVDLVTEVDLASEACIREALDKTGIPVFGEEGGGVADGLRWVVDPLDGTTNFVHGFPFWCVSIGLMDGEDTRAGCIFDPVRGALYRARVGGGATVDGRPLRVSSCRNLDAALTASGFAYDRRTRAKQYLAYVERALVHTQGFRRGGSAAMDLVHLADGRLDLYWEFNLSPWDTCAGALLVREAGGTVTTMDGGPWHPGRREVLATNGWLHDAAIQLFQGLEQVWASQ